MCSTLLFNRTHFLHPKVPLPFSILSPPPPPSPSTTAAVGRGTGFPAALSRGSFPLSPSLAGPGHAGGPALLPSSDGPSLRPFEVLLGTGPPTSQLRLARVGQGPSGIGRGGVFCFGGRLGLVAVRASRSAVLFRNLKERRRIATRTRHWPPTVLHGCGRDGWSADRPRRRARGCGARAGVARGVRQP